MKTIPLASAVCLFSLAAFARSARACELSESDLSNLKKSQSKIASQEAADALPEDEQKVLCDTREAIGKLDKLEIDEVNSGPLQKPKENKYLSSDERLKVRNKQVADVLRKTLNG